LVKAKTRPFVFVRVCAWHHCTAPPVCTSWCTQYTRLVCLRVILSETASLCWTDSTAAVCNQAQSLFVARDVPSNIIWNICAFSHQPAPQAASIASCNKTELHPLCALHRSTAQHTTPIANPTTPAPLRPILRINMHAFTI